MLFLSVVMLGAKAVFKGTVRPNKKITQTSKIPAVIKINCCLFTRKNIEQ